MFAVLGASGHVGTAVTQYLLQQGQAVTVVLRNPQKAAAWAQRGASVALVDVHDTDALAQVLQKADRAFVLNPPANPALDTDKAERATVQSILQALRGAKLEKIVVQSTYGAQPGTECADLGVLYDLEQGARQTGIPLCCVRAAYYMSNWLSAVPEARTSGKVSSLLPATLPVPMVAPQDVGVYTIEGPTPYTAQDVAQVFAHILQHPVQVEDIPPTAWLAYYKANGFSDKAARSYANMTAIFINQRYDRPANPVKGVTDLASYLRAELAGCTP
ncbi:NmrA family NAD(P)-binding protein [Acetobacter pasteurianus]|uniref:Oxidoreductase n=1 Tax=Acetobacter pasteurianus NBRC 3188 TaxID=1226663 RepID=A0A401WQY1_ACEPA|nr:NAD(P)H-binding protein [Acetobacter pasteurianus]GCD51707.1 oxidoreductase [Acetobacter pasteurianus NBRC 3188]